MVSVPCLDSFCSSQHCPPPAVERSGKTPGGLRWVEVGPYTFRRTLIPVLRRSPALLPPLRALIYLPSATLARTFLLVLMSGERFFSWRFFSFLEHLCSIERRGSGIRRFLTHYHKLLLVRSYCSPERERCRHISRVNIVSCYNLMEAKYKQDQDAVAIGLVQHGQGRYYLGLRADGL